MTGIKRVYVFFDKVKIRGYFVLFVYLLSIEWERKNSVERVDK